MNFDDAIAAHIKWKVLLTQFIDGSSTEKLSSATACKDNLCNLGKWIYGEGTKYKGMTQYQDLVKKHAGFHLRASEVVAQVEHQNPNAARTLLGGAFSAASRETVTAIMELRKAATKAPA